MLLKERRSYLKKMRFRFLLPTVLVFLNACSFQSAPDKLRQELQTISSWAATTRMAGEALLNGHVPSAYAARAFETAHQNLQDEGKALEQSSDIPAEQRAKVQTEVTRLQQIIGQLKTSAER